ncbi:MAG: hypothetical protein COZ06_01680 [Armatimonadetes bacterium CG_4_10_14_3_um_filter_66_18]|nr:hypothetical protein [Armatimonadota bacterium]NDK12098.1 hypothetical protein [Armatimonadota bacterium]PIY53487.1 MAG: hypothetical protein COZ06_01680 [Armatimonadetes bacterium CG_4_10_14_3_um_filter_66_18]
MARTSLVALIGGLCVTASWLWLFSSRAGMDRERALWGRFARLQTELADRPAVQEQLKEVRENLDKRHLEAASEKLTQVERQARWLRGQSTGEEGRPPQSPDAAPGQRVEGEGAGSPGGGPGMSGTDMRGKRNGAEQWRRGNWQGKAPAEGMGGEQAGAGERWQEERERLMVFAAQLPPADRERVLRETAMVGAEVGRQAKEGGDPAPLKALQRLIRRAGEGRLTADQYLTELRHLGAQTGLNGKAPVGERGRPSGPERTQRAGATGPQPWQRGAGREAGGGTGAAPQIPPMALEALAGRWGGGGKAPRELAELRLDNPRLVVLVDPRTGSLTVTDRVTRRTWRAAAGVDSPLEGAKVEERVLTARLSGGFPCRLRVALADADLRIELTPEAVLSPGETLKPVIAYPPAFATAGDGHFALPRENQPSFVPVASGNAAWLHVAAVLTSPWFGYADPRGGYVVALEGKPGWEVALRLEAPKGSSRLLSPVWAGTPESLGQTLAATIRFTSETTFPGLARMSQLLTDLGSPAAAWERSQ